MKGGDPTQFREMLSTAKQIDRLREDGVSYSEIIATFHVELSQRLAQVEAELAQRRASTMQKAQPQ